MNNLDHLPRNKKNNQIYPIFELFKQKYSSFINNFNQTTSIFQGSFVSIENFPNLFMKFRWYFARENSDKMEDSLTTKQNEKHKGKALLPSVMKQKKVMSLVFVI